MKEISKKNAEILGKDTLLWQLQEECGELIKAVGKYNRSRGIGQKTEVSTYRAFKDLCTEIADVEICIEQLKYVMRINTSDLKNKAYKKVSKRYSDEDEYERLANEIIRKCF